MIEFACEGICSWAFVRWKIFNHTINFSACDWSVYIFCFFLVQSRKVSKNLSISSRLSILLAYSCLSNLSWSFVFLKCQLLLLLHFNLLLWVFSLFFLMSLANGLSSLFIFSKNKLLVLLIFAIISFISFSFISDRMFMIFFLLLTLGFFLFFFL